MIEIIDENNGFKCVFEGYIQRVPYKIGYNTITSIRGVNYTEKLRSVVNLNITIERLDETEYDNLEKIFMFSESDLKINDLDKGKIYTSYYINGDTLSLTEKEDYETKEFYYTGALTLNRR